MYDLTPLNVGTSSATAGLLRPVQGRGDSKTHY